MRHFFIAMFLTAGFAVHAGSDLSPCWNPEHPRQMHYIAEGKSCPFGWLPGLSPEAQATANRAEEMKSKRFTESAVEGAALGGALGLIVALWFILSAIFKRRKASRKSKGELRQRLWAAALDEVELGNIDKPTWAEAYSQAGGIDTAARARYLELRVKRWESEN